MSLNVISLTRDLFPDSEKIKLNGEDYIYYFSYKKDKIFSVLEFCKRVKANRCIFISRSDIKLPSGSVVKEITYDKALEYENLFPKELIVGARKNNIEIVFVDINSMKTTKIRNFIEHT